MKRKLALLGEGEGPWIRVGDLKNPRVVVTGAATNVIEEWREDGAWFKASSLVPVLCCVEGD